MRHSGGLLGYAVLTFALHQNVHAEGGIACKDIQGRSYESGLPYIPGSEPCTFCVCDNGNPKWCKAFICKFPEEDCKSFRRGDTCCEFICLDDTLSSISNEKTDGSGGSIADVGANYDLGLRLVASFVTAILSLTLLFFLIHRLRQRKIRVCVAGRQSRELTEDQRNLGGMGYLERGGLAHGMPLDDMPCGGGYPLWKPPGNYFPCGEAPPPYEESVAASRAEQALLSMSMSSSPHALSPFNLNLSNGYSSNHTDHGPVEQVSSNVQPQIGLTASSPSLLHSNSNSNNGASTSPLIVSSSSAASSSCHRAPLGSPSAYANDRPNGRAAEALLSGLENGVASTASFPIGTNTYENLPVPGATRPPPPPAAAVDSNSVQRLSASHSTIPKVYRQHTTLPRQSGAFTISASLPSTSDISAHRTIPRTLAARNNGVRLREIPGDFSVEEFLQLPPRCGSPQHSPRSAPPTVTSNENNTLRSEPFYRPVEKNGSSGASARNEGHKANVTPTKPCDFKPSLNIANEINEEGSFDSVTCTCSMQALPTLHDDADDYRSECENCKSATGSRYYLDNEDKLVTSPHETMTLHRRPEETASGATPQYYRTSLTLPTSTRQRTRSTGVRENWFTTMPQSSTESSDEN